MGSAAGSGKSDQQPTTCVVGAGPSGLALAKAFTDLGLPVEVYERHTDIGGLWDETNPGTPVYRTAHFISSKTMSGFPNFPMPDEFPDYPSHRQILAYLRSYADEYKLRNVITTGCGVKHAEFDSDSAPRKWTVEFEDGTTKTFDHLVCANGSQWHPNHPDIAGEFAGELIHAVDYWSNESLRDKRVLVIGGGNSAVDIACDAASVAETAMISMRRGYYLIPKHVFGQPSDVFASTGPELPAKVTQWVFPLLLRMLVGRPERYGLQTPDHKIFETHPILNSEILHFLSHGDLTAKPDVERFDGSTVHFTDGTSADFDVVITATGYKVKVPYVDESMFEWKHDRPQLYMHAFHRSNPRLHALGFTEGDGGAYEIFFNTADAIGNLVKMLHDRPEREEEWCRFVGSADSDFRGGLNLLDTPRHTNYLHISEYRKGLDKLREQFDWPAPT